MNCKKPLRGKKGNRGVCGCKKDVEGRQKRDGVGGTAGRFVRWLWVRCGRA